MAFFSFKKKPSRIPEVAINKHIDDDANSVQISSQVMQDLLASCQHGTEKAAGHGSFSEILKQLADLKTSRSILDFS